MTLGLALVQMYSSLLLSETDFSPMNPNSHRNTITGRFISRIWKPLSGAFSGTEAAKFPVPLLLRYLPLDPLILAIPLESHWISNRLSSVIVLATASIQPLAVTPQYVPSYVSIDHLFFLCSYSICAKNSVLHHTNSN